MNWLLRFFRKAKPLPKPALDSRGWQIVDHKRSHAFKH